MIPSITEARELLRRYNKGDFHLLHGEIMSRLMHYFAREHDPGREEYWAVVGMLHDIDFELYPDEHCNKCWDILREHNIDEAMIVSIASHGYGKLTWVTVKPELQMEKILSATDELSGLIGACGMVRPSKTIMDMDVSSLKKKFKKKDFASGCSRDDILMGAEMLGIPLDELLEQTLTAMKTFAEELHI